MISPNSNIPWFKQSHKRVAGQKRRAYDKAKHTDAPDDWDYYRQLRRSLDRSLRKSRSEHVQGIGESLSTSNTKPFWRYIKSLRQGSAGISALNTLNGIATSALDKANALSDQFRSVFTKED